MTAPNRSRALRRPIRRLTDLERRVLEAVAEGEATASTLSHRVYRDRTHRVRCLRAADHLVERGLVERITREHRGVEIAIYRITEEET